VPYQLSIAPPEEDRPHLYDPVTNPDHAALSPWSHTPEARPVEHAYLVYAHPDDETIFAGGLMLAYPSWQWTLVRFVHGGEKRDRDHARAVELFAQEGVQFADVRCLHMDDSWLTWRDRRRWREALLDAIPEEPDVVITHGVRGEYGHPHHISIHHQVHTLFDNVWNFYHPSGLSEEPQLIMGRVHRIPTDSRKAWIMARAYPEMMEAIGNSNLGIIEAQFSGRPEFFTR
jgi:LmbE family N-acetylglucosaminyl deacetylase